eukprot:jgi/Botrbrau1/13581/Bobra.0307s0004.1
MAENLPTWACTPERGGHLYLKYRDEKGTDIILCVDKKRGYLIGRNKACDIVVKDKTASRFHAGIVHDEEGQCFLVDMGSAHGTYMDGNRLEHEGKEILQPDAPGRSNFTVGRCPSRFQLTREGSLGAQPRSGGPYKPYRSTEQGPRRPLPQEGKPGRPGSRPDAPSRWDPHKRVYTPGHYGEHPSPYDERGGSPGQHHGGGYPQRGRGMRPMGATAQRAWSHNPNMPGGPNFRGRGYIDFRGRPLPGRNFGPRGRGRLGYGPRPDDRYQPEPEPVLYETEDGLVVAEEAFEGELMAEEAEPTHEGERTRSIADDLAHASAMEHQDAEHSAKQPEQQHRLADGAEATLPGLPTPTQQVATGEEQQGPKGVADSTPQTASSGQRHPSGGQDGTSKSGPQSVRPRSRSRRGTPGNEKSRSTSRPSRWGPGSDEEGTPNATSAPDVPPRSFAQDKGISERSVEQAGGSKPDSDQGLLRIGTATDAFPEATLFVNAGTAVPSGASAVEPDQAAVEVEVAANTGSVGVQERTLDAVPVASDHPASKEFSAPPQSVLTIHSNGGLPVGLSAALPVPGGMGVAPPETQGEAVTASPSKPGLPKESLSPVGPAGVSRGGLVPPEGTVSTSKALQQVETADDVGTSSESDLPAPLARLAARRAQRESQARPASGLLARLSGTSRRPLTAARLPPTPSDTDEDAEDAAPPAADAALAGLVESGPSQAPAPKRVGEQDAVEAHLADDGEPVGALERLAQYDGSSEDEAAASGGQAQAPARGRLEGPGRQAGIGSGSPERKRDSTARRVGKDHHMEGETAGAKEKRGMPANSSESEEQMDSRKENRRNASPRGRKRDRGEREWQGRDGDWRGDRREVDHRRREAPRGYYDDRRGYRDRSPLGSRRFERSRGWRGGPPGRFSRDFPDRRYEGRFGRDRFRGGFINKGRERRPYDRSPRRERSPRRGSRRSRSSSYSRSASRERGRKRARSTSSSSSKSDRSGGPPPPVSKQRTSGFGAPPPEFAGMDPADVVKHMGMGPGGTSATGLTVEAKKKLLWGKKPEPEVAKDAEEVFGANRWDAAEFDDETEKQKFIKLMGVKGVAPTALTKEQAIALAQAEPSEREALSRDKAGRVLAEVEHQFMEGLRRADGRSLGLGL